MQSKLFALLLALVLVAGAAPAFAQSVAAEPTPSLEQREIDLLKLRLEKAQKDLRQEQTARIVYQTQIQDAALHGYRVEGLLAFAPLTKKVLDRIFVDSIQKQYPGRAFELYHWVLRFFGAIPEDLDLIPFYKALMSEQAAGLYDPMTKKLYVSPSFDITGPMGRMILAHEIDHALQDQNFDLEGMGIMEPDNNDRSTALMAIVEGDATLLMGEVVANSNPFAILADLPKMAMMDQSQLSAAPPALSNALIFPYVGGMAFFNGLAGRTRQHPDAGPGRMSDPSWRNEVFLKPPTSTEQILHPEKYLANEQPADIESIARGDGDDPHLIRDVIGEFGMRLLLAAELDETRANAAAAGWNGDRILVTESDDGKHHTLHWITRWDTHKDADEFQSAIADALAKRFKDAGLKWNVSAEGKTEDGAAAQPETEKATFGNTTITINRSGPAEVRLDVATDLIPDLHAE